MSLAKKKELRCKIDLCILHDKYVWYNKKTISQNQKDNFNLLWKDL